MHNLIYAAAILEILGYFHSGLQANTRLDLLIGFPIFLGLTYFAGRFLAEKKE